jgi:hypothetical protein
MFGEESRNFQSKLFTETSALTRKKKQKRGNQTIEPRTQTTDFITSLLFKWALKVL